MPPKKAAGEKKTKSTSSGGRKKGATPYNIYMKKKLEEFKSKYPDLNHKDRFKKVAEEWAESPENPKNAVAKDEE